VIEQGVTLGWRYDVALLLNWVHGHADHSNEMIEAGGHGVKGGFAGEAVTSIKRNLIIDRRKRGEV